jgi:hypothetical protein
VDVGLNLTEVGVIFVIAGCVGAFLSVMFWSSWGGFGVRRDTHTTVVER